jgi:exodeoxyribonuclease VIII
MDNIVTDMTNEDYHAHDAISSSDVKMVHSKSLAHWKAKVYKSTPSFDIGTAVHAMVLEGDKDIVVRGPEDRRGNKWKDAQTEAEANGKLLLTLSDYDMAREMADSLLMHPVGQRMADVSTVNEVSFFATDPATGLKLKTRPDSYWQEQGVLYDIKTCQDANPFAFSRDFHKYNYAIQAAFYMHVIRLCGKPAKNFVFAAVEKSAPYEVSVHVVSEEYLAWAEKHMTNALAKIADAQQSGRYGTGWPEVNVIDLPNWLQQEADF